MLVTDWDIRDIIHSKQVFRFPVSVDGSLGEPELLWREDEKTLFLAAHTGLYKIRVKTGGKMPGISK